MKKGDTKRISDGMLRIDGILKDREGCSYLIIVEHQSNDGRPTSVALTPGMWGAIADIDPPCPNCAGSGTVPGNGRWEHVVVQTCDNCKGSGRVRPPEYQP
jgi:hypothetical protein